MKCLSRSCEGFMILNLGGAKVEGRSPQNPTQVFANFANSRRNCDSVIHRPERFEGFTHWHLPCFDLHRIRSMADVVSRGHEVTDSPDGCHTESATVQWEHFTKGERL